MGYWKFDRLSPKEPPKVGKPPYYPDDKTRRQVQAMVQYGVPVLQISKVVGIGKVTLEKYYRREIDIGHVQANAKVAESLFQNAVKHNNVAAQIFWCKTRMGWKETMVLEPGSGGIAGTAGVLMPHNNRDDVPIEVQVKEE
jgi:hypothetical protein